MPGCPSGVRGLSAEARAHNCRSAGTVFSERKTPTYFSSENAVAALLIAKSNPRTSEASYEHATGRPGAGDLWHDRQPLRTKGVRDRLSQHLWKVFLEGEHDPHRLTVHGLSYLQKLDRERDS
jgi:hypothetical protein